MSAHLENSGMMSYANASVRRVTPSAHLGKHGTVITANASVFLLHANLDIHGTVINANVLITQTLN